LRKQQPILLLMVLVFVLISCEETINTDTTSSVMDSTPHCYKGTFSNLADDLWPTVKIIRADLTNMEDFSGMVKIEGGDFLMGSNSSTANKDEKPVHLNKVNSFWMDEHEVTNAQFRAFVNATGYVTTAEKRIKIDRKQSQLPERITNPNDNSLQPGALVFQYPTRKREKYNSKIHWEWTKEANWRRPQGLGSSIIDKDNHPVVQVSWYDAMAYARWAGKRLPTETEWEYAARGGMESKEYPWGNSFDEEGHRANCWQGEFPYDNSKMDGYERTAPVKSYKKNSFGLYDIAGNVREWCTDLYSDSHYLEKKVEGMSVNPSGAAYSSDPELPGASQRVIRGGSFLCNELYGKGYRVSKRMKSTPDIGIENTGFRCVRSIRYKTAALHKE